MGITFKRKGDWSQTKKGLKKYLKWYTNNKTLFETYGQKGVDALAAATPVDTGRTANSWYYEVVPINNGVKIEWKNSNKSQNIPVIYLIEYGHVTRRGGYVPPRPFIKKTIEPIMQELEDALGGRMK